MDFWIKHNYNVLFIGRAGVGKSASVIEAFNRSELRWKYFSASTMDPWVDFIGVPKEKEDSNGSYLELVRPQEFQNDEIEALFFDEFSRSHKKVRNAVLELIQFKSINGKKFNNLRMVWAAINPEEDDGGSKYDVDALDPAQMDRFHVKVEMPYLPHAPYFKQKYGNSMASAAIGWWKALPNETKNNVSPRRLDYALDMYKNNGDMRDVLPHEANVSRLITEINYGSIAAKLRNLYKDGDKEKVKQFLAIENNYTASIDAIINKSEYMIFFLPLIEDEKIVSLMAKNAKVMNFLLKNNTQFKTLLIEVVKAGQNKRLVNKIAKELNISLAFLPPKKDFDCIVNDNHHQFKRKTKAVDDYDDALKASEKARMTNTIIRRSVFLNLRNSMPLVPSQKQAIKTLELLSVVVSRSYPSSLHTQSGHFIGLINMINHCFDVLYQSGEKDLRDIQDKHLKIGKAIDFGMKHKKIFYFNFVEK